MNMLVRLLLDDFLKFRQRRLHNYVYNEDFNFIKIDTKNNEFELFQKPLGTYDVIFNKITRSIQKR